MLGGTRSVVGVLAAAALVVPAGFAAGSVDGRPGPDGPPGAESVVGGELEPRSPLPFFYDLYTFRNDRGGTTVVTAVAVQAQRLRSVRADNRFQYRFDVRFVLADTARRTVVPSIDSVYVAVSRPLARGHLLHTYVQVDAPPSTATVQRVVVTDASRPGVGQLYTSPFPIPDYSGAQLMLSDIAFGLPEASAGWSRRDFTLALLPTSLFPESSFDVYYEIYNLPAGNPYETEISIEPLDDEGTGRVVRTLFTGESTAGGDDTLGELRRIQSALGEGRYRMTVKVRDRVTGQVAQRSRPVHVRAWERGTTMVPAMPRGPRAVARR